MSEILPNCMPGREADPPEHFKITNHYILFKRFVAYIPMRTMRFDRILRKLIISVSAHVRYDTTGASDTEGMPRIALCKDYTWNDRTV
jgi:hypothetical protein